MEPFLKEETTTKTANKVTFSINQNGEIEFDATGLEEWETTQVIEQITKQAQKQQKATQTKQLASLTSDFAMHGMAFAFALLLSLGFGFTVSRIVKSFVEPQTTTQSQLPVNLSK